VNDYSQKIGILFGATAMLVAQPLARVASAQMQAVQSQATEQGFVLKFSTDSAERPQIFTIQRDNVLVVDLTDTQLDLGDSDRVQQSNPFPGVESLSVAQNDNDSVRVIVRGTNDAPNAQIQSFANGEVTLSFAVEGGGGTAPTAQESPPSEQTFSQEPETSSNSSASQEQGEPEVMFPNPDLTVDGEPVNGQSQRPSPGLQPTRPRAVAPPVGDIAVSTIDSSPDMVNLGTNTRVPRLVLREAPVREVLSLLARSANVNLVFADQSSGEDEENPAEQTISVDLEDEPVQSAFNSILQLSGLEANRRGNTIFVGANLPQQVRNIMTRTLRLNQVTVDTASNFLATQGAEAQQVVDKVERVFNQETGAIIREIDLPDEIAPISVNRPDNARGALLLQGLSISSDPRLNAITLVGEPRKIATAVDLLKQLDARRRQVAVNVKIIDVNLNNTEEFSSSFSFGINDSFFVSDGGAAAVNFGGTIPPTRASTTVPGQPTPPVVPTPIPDGATAEPFFDVNPDAAFSDPGVSGASPGFGVPSPLPVRPNFGTDDNPFQPGISDIDEDGIEFSVPGLFQFPSRFLSLLEAQVTSGNAKILTDPTLLIKEGQTAGVNLTQEVVGNIIRETESSEGLTTTTTTAEIEEAGLTLNIDVQRIDDNGFITLNVNPTVTSISGTQNLNIGGDDNVIALLNRRELNSGEIRLRDGQTLVLAGIIQDEDRTTVTKVPILGDLPIIGSLFRSTNRDNIRREVIVLLTPNVLDESLGASGYGSSYQLSPSAREMLQQQGYPIPQQRR